MPNMETIKPFRVAFSDEEVEEFLTRARNVLESGHLIPGTNARLFEEGFRRIVEAKYATTVASGTAALEIIFRSLGLNGTDVLAPANTNYATVEAIMRAGGRPVLYDAGLYPDPDSIERAVTAKSRAVVVVHIGGYISPSINDIVSFCRDREILLIEDAAHAHGSRYKGRSAGTFGTAAAFSTFATKVITTSEGGVVVTDSQHVRDLALVYRDQGKDEAGTRNVLFGSAWRMSELHASLGVVQLCRFDKRLQRNNQIIDRYVSEIDRENIEVPYDIEAVYSGYKFIVLLSDTRKRNSLKSHLLETGIEPAKGVYDVPIHRQPALDAIAHGSYPAAEKFADTHLCLPMWHGLTDEEVGRVIAEVNRWAVSL